MQCCAGILLVTLLTACQKSPQYGYIEGETMGTSYHIRYQQPKDVDSDALKQKIDARLVQINDSMSTYQDDSIISAFNAMPAGQSLPIDADFVNVLTDAKQVHTLSGGAFDPTVMPLINLWGFGKVTTVERLQDPPTPEDIATAKALIDFDSIVLTGTELKKTKAGVEIDFSAVAKGYAVDVIADVLKNDYQINSYMVEIGGEVATSGVNQKMQPWQIAIDAPVMDSSVSERQMIAAIRQPSGGQLHLATSGNYRNSVIFDGKRYSHTIDPSTGQPIVGGAPSVSVVAETVSLADAWATALTAMPYDKAMTTATKQNLAAMFIIPKDGKIHDDITPTPSDDPLEIWQITETPAMTQLRSGQ